VCSEMHREVVHYSENGSGTPTLSHVVEHMEHSQGIGVCVCDVCVCVLVVCGVCVCVCLLRVCDVSVRV